MTTLLYLICYLATIVFVLACLTRITIYARAPMHLRWELYPIPHEEPARVKHGGSRFEEVDWWTKQTRFRLMGELKFMVPEMLFLKGLYEFNRKLWYRSFPFHFGLYLLIGTLGLLLAAAMLSILAPASEMESLVDAIQSIYRLTGAAGLFLAVLGAIGLLARRLTDESLKNYTTPGDIFNLIFFIITLGTLSAASLITRSPDPDMLAITKGIITLDTTLRISEPLRCRIISCGPAHRLYSFDPHVALHRQIFYLPFGTVGRHAQSQGWKARSSIGRISDVQADLVGSTSGSGRQEDMGADRSRQTGAGGKEVKGKLKLSDMSRQDKTPLAHLENEDLKPLPNPFNNPALDHAWTPLTEQIKSKYECILDDTCAVSIPQPKTREEENELVGKFISGLEKLFTKENNWPFLQPLLLTMEHCARCQTCSEACHIFEASGNHELYRPNFRSEIMRRLYYKHVKRGGLLSAWQNGDIVLNWPLVARLIELAYRCNLCRRCAQTCPIGADNGLVAHELRKLFSQEMGIAAKEIHKNGSMLQLKVGSSTGMNAVAVKDNVEFIDEDMTEKSGLEVKTPWDVEGADVLLIHNAGEIMAWPENPGAFALILNAAGIRWTLSSEIAGYDAINYGLWYDDAQFARVAVKHAEAARKLGVKKIVLGECGHAHKALSVVADRVLSGDLNIPRESSMALLHDIVRSGRIRLDPSRNNFPVTLHDPCNMVRLMGVVEPQREIIRKICPQFREMTPHGVDNYCCGGGSGFAIMSGNNFPDWRFQVAGRKKLEQILNAFSDCLDPSFPKYVCAPCSNCKGQIRDLLAYYDLWDNHRIFYGGLVELIANAMVDAKPGFIEWEWH